MLFAFGGVQSFGAAMLFANSPTILTGNFPANQRGQALGLQAKLTYLGLTVGPSHGSWLTQQFGWQTVFFINIPIGLLALFFCLKFIPDDRNMKEADPFDWPELFLQASPSRLLLLRQTPIFIQLSIGVLRQVHALP